MIISPRQLQNRLNQIKNIKDSLQHYLDDEDSRLISSVIEEFKNKYSAYLVTFKNKRKTHSELNDLLTTVNKYYTEHVHALYKILIAYDQPITNTHSENDLNFKKMLKNNIKVYKHKIAIKELNKRHNLIKKNAIALQQVYDQLSISEVKFSDMSNSYYRLMEIEVIEKSSKLLYSLKQESKQQIRLRKNLKNISNEDLNNYERMLQKNDEDIKDLKHNYESLKRKTEKLVTAEILLKICKQIDKKIKQLRTELYLPFFDKVLTRSKIEALENLKANFYEGSNSNKEIREIIAAWKKIIFQFNKDNQHKSIDNKQECKLTYADILAKERPFTLFSSRKHSQANFLKKDSVKNTSSINLIDDIEKKYGQCTINIQKP